MSVDWNFPESNYSQRYGISEAGIETYRGSLFASLAKEVCQNSLDARLDFSKPVTVEFSKFQVKTKTIPGYPKLNDALNRCLYNETDNKAKQFFENACAKMSDKTMDILRISDFNTTGLIGSKEAYVVNPWQSLVKSSGISDKYGALGGSYGIGKSAPFACSDIRTIFYSTFDIEGILATQGVSRLISFPIDDTKNTQGLGYQISLSGPAMWKVKSAERFTQGIGYYGETEKNTPFFEELNMDSSFSRNGKTGTDLYIMGFMDRKKWQEELAIAILDNFLIAIYNKNLIIKIGDMVISSYTLQNVLETFKINEKKKYLSIWSYYKVLTSTDSPEDHPNSFLLGDVFKDLGDFELKILYDNLNRKVLISRSNGMKVFDLDRLPSGIHFSAVFILSGDKLNSYFKEMEAPQHDSWEPDRHPDENAKNILKELKQMIRDKIIELGSEGEPEDYMDADGIGTYLPGDFLLLNDGEEAAIGDKVKDERKEILQKETDSMPKKRNTNAFLKNSEDFSNIKIKDSDGANDFTDEAIQFVDSIFGNTPVSNSDSNKDNRWMIKDFSPLDSDDNPVEIKEINLLKDVGIRLITLNKKMKKYKLVVLPKRDIEKGCIRISLSGEQSSLKAKIRNAYKDDVFDSPLTIKQDKIYVEGLSKDQKFSLSFILNYSDDCSMEVELYEYRI